MNNLRSVQKSWEELGTLDPFWAILTDPNGKHGKWDKQAFFATGDKEVKHALERAKRKNLPKHYKTMLDFGCGVGRVTRAFTKYFDACYGVDIAKPMVQLAKRLHKNSPNLRFIHNTDTTLAKFKDNSFDLVYSNIVLQHNPNKAVILSYVASFIRIVAPNGLIIFQLPSYIPLRQRLQLKNRLYTFLRKTHVGEQFLYTTLGLFPIRMQAVAQKEVVAHIQSHGGKVVAIYRDKNAGEVIQSRTYYVTKS